ncbi:MAG: type II CAAX endopeptidase family protein [Terriglobia bacterium]
MKIRGWHQYRNPRLEAFLTFLIVYVGSLSLAPSSTDQQVFLRSTLLQLGLVFGMPYLVDRLLAVNLRNDFRWQATSLRNLVFSFLVALSLIVLLETLISLEVQLFGSLREHQSSVAALLKLYRLSELGWTLLAIGLVPAFCEEILFRGFIFSRFLRPGHTAEAIMLSSILFGLFHRQLDMLFNNTLAGVVLALVVYRSGSLLNSILVHAIVNSGSIVLANWADISPAISTESSGLWTWFSLGASLLGTLIGLKGLRLTGSQTAISGDPLSGPNIDPPS